MNGRQTIGDRNQLISYGWNTDETRMVGRSNPAIRLSSVFHPWPTFGLATDRFQLSIRFTAHGRRTAFHT
jgi:hypothetical protein